jgi:hypothetical protein
VRRSATSPGEGQGVGRALLVVGLVLFVAGAGTCGYVIATGGIGAARRPGGGSDARLVLIGFAALLGALLAGAVGRLVARASRRPGSHGYGASFDDDMW